MEATKKTAKDPYVIQIPGLDYKPNPGGLGCTYYECMTKNNNKIAQIDGLTGEKDTYKNLLQRCIRTAISMQNLGIKQKDYISICSFNHLNSGVPLIASYFIGAVMAAVDPTLSIDETVYYLNLTSPKLIFVQSESTELIEKALQKANLSSKLVIFGDTQKHIPFSQFVEPKTGEENFKPLAVDLKDVASVYFTSGTTGLPKAACHSHYAILCQLINSLERKSRGSLSFAHASPYWTVFGSFLGGSILKGGTRLILPRYDPEDPWKPLEFKVTNIFVNPPQVLRMVKVGRPKDLDLSSLKFVYVGGGVLSLAQFLEIKDTFKESTVLVTYGQTEVPGGLVEYNVNKKEALEFIEKKPNSAGTGIPGISYKISDPETEESLGPHQQGELRVKSDFCLSGYLNADSAAIWDKDNFLKTGDLAYYDEDNCFYVVDRIKEMFKYQGWHVVPAVLEAILLEHPAVDGAVVVGVPHELDGEHGMGVVTLKEQFLGFSAEEIEKYVNDRVSDRQKLRAGVKIVDSFPLTASGKISRRKLKTMLINI